MNLLTVKPNDKFLRNYYATLEEYSQFHLDHEGTVRSPLQVVYVSQTVKIVKALPSLGLEANDIAHA